MAKFCQGRQRKRTCEALSDERSVNVIAEPGRFFNESAGTLVVNIYGKRRKTHPADEAGDDKPGLEGRKIKGYDYFVNNGIFSSFGRNLIDYGDVPPAPVDEKMLKKPKLTTTVYGSTCAEMDYCNEECELPELNIGDWLFYEDIGAYHCINEGSFNGFQPPVKFNYALPQKLLSFVEQLDDEETHPEGKPWQARGATILGAIRGAIRNRMTGGMQCARKPFVCRAPDDDNDDFSLNDD
ncbi:probable ornithine decarboxylase [Amphiura filiformis]|uniref:probable ornithine decarboxylase n=1 Tax=Amphiura filiformis TaxID=82378 RepID=UPI003B2207D3